VLAQRTGSCLTATRRIPSGLLGVQRLAQQPTGAGTTFLRWPAIVTVPIMGRRRCGRRLLADPADTGPSLIDDL